MKFSRTRLFLIAAIMGAAPLLAAPKMMPNPDFTKGEKVPVDASKDWNLGPTGLRGWMHTHQLATAYARQVLITSVAAGSPAEDHFQKGDVLLGVAGKAFWVDPRMEIGKAIAAAEAGDGKLTFTRWRDGATAEVTLMLQVLGSWGPTAPYDCAKSKAVMNKTAQALAKRMAAPDYKGNPITRSLNALGLLATGDPKYHSVIKKEAEWAAAQEIESMATWWYGYITVFLAEYVMATGDKSVLPGLKRINMQAANGQSAVGSWGHKFANEHGRLRGYGMMNSPGATLTIGMVLSREAGVKDPKIDLAIDRSYKLLRFYIGKGSVPYGDHSPFNRGHEDNGKNGMVAVLFDQLGDRKGTKFFSQMNTAAHYGERDCGHTGNFFNVTWAIPGVSRSGPHATGAWMKEFGGWYFDLARCWDWSFPHQGPSQARKDSYGNWDATGMYLIALGMDRKAIRLCGSKPSCISALPKAKAQEIVTMGGAFNWERPTAAYENLPPDLLLELLGGWSPIVRERAGEAIARKHQNIPLETFMRMLKSADVNVRLGACEALKHLRSRAAPAVPGLADALKAQDMWLRIKAAEALAGIGKPALGVAPQLMQIVAKGPTAEDPRGMEQRYMINALFNGRSGLLRDSLNAVDRAQLHAAIRAALVNEDGRARGNLAMLYRKMSFDDLKPLLPSIHKAIIEKSPSGIMFDGTIQDAGLDLYSRNHVNEGIELIADYIWQQKPHGSEKRVTKYCDMLKRYGAHAQRAIPKLEKAIHYFENEEKDFPKRLSMGKAEDVRKAIAEIKVLADKPKLVNLRDLVK